MIINWYKQNTGVIPDVDFDEKNYNNEFNFNDASLQQKILNLKEKIFSITEKKNYYKSKVKL